MGNVDIAARVGLVAFDALVLLIDLRASAHRAVERALRALVRLLIVYVL
jgi:hypothetical protein